MENLMLWHFTPDALFLGPPVVGGD